MNEILLSIVVPSYNVENYIYQTLKSIYDCKLKYFEIIIVDDGSTDNSIDRVREFMINNSVTNITIHKQNNSGVSSARNKGFLSARGKYVYFLDSDDLVDKNMNIIESLIRQDFDTDVLLFKFAQFKDNAEHKQDFSNETSEIVEYRNFNKLLDDVIIKKVKIWTGSIIFNRSFLVNNNLRYYEGCSFGEDIEFIFKAIVRASRILYFDKTLSYYRIRENSAINSLNLAQIDGIYARIRLINEYNSYKRFVRYIKKQILITYKNVMINNTLRVLNDNSILHKKKFVREAISMRYPNLEIDMKRILRGEVYLLWKEYYLFKVSKKYNSIVYKYIRYRKRKLI